MIRTLSLGESYLGRRIRHSHWLALAAGVGSRSSNCQCGWRKYANQHPDDGQPGDKPLHRDDVVQAPTAYKGKEYLRKDKLHTRRKQTAAITLAVEVRVIGTSKDCVLLKHQQPPLGAGIQRAKD
jgi:hypothetical protein